MENLPRKTWCARFEAKDGSFHPVWFTDRAKDMTKKEAREQAKAYLARNASWLKKVSGIY
jgi:hypothetical protein